MPNDARSPHVGLHGARAAADSIARAFAPNAPIGLPTAHVRTMLGTPEHVIARSYAGMQTDLTVWTSAEAAAWERSTPHVPGSRVDRWPGTGRYLHEEHPERTIRVVDDWAKETATLR